MDVLKMLKKLSVPEYWNECTDGLKSYIDLTEKLAEDVCHWRSLGDYGRYIAQSPEAIDNNLRDPSYLNMDQSVATLICVHRHQYWNGGYTDVVKPRIEDGSILKRVEHIEELMKRELK